MPNSFQTPYGVEEIERLAAALPLLRRIRSILVSATAKAAPEQGTYAYDPAATIDDLDELIEAITRFVESYEVSESIDDGPGDGPEDGPGTNGSKGIDLEQAARLATAAAETLRLLERIGNWLGWF